MAGGPRETAKIDTFHVWAYPASIYRLRALNYFVCILDVISDKISRWCEGVVESVFELQRAEVRTSRIAGKLCLPYLRKTSNDIGESLYADRTWVVLQHLPKH